MPEILKEEGQFTATVVENDLRQTGGGTPFAYLLFSTPKGVIACQVWLTKKAMRMARAQLKACGFDMATEKLSVLKENKQHLAAKEQTVKIVVEEEEYRGSSSLKCRIITNALSKTRLEELDKEFMAKDDVEDDGDDIPF